MRIISGKYKGRIIQMPKGIRPTQNKVRKALFDTLGDIEGLSLLELFAGSGAVGVEALSHGIKEAVFVENNPDCVRALKDNFTYLPPTTYHLLPLDTSLTIKKLFKAKKRFDIIFMDPPYYQGPAAPSHIPTPPYRSGGYAASAAGLAMHPAESERRVSRILRDVPLSAATPDHKGLVGVPLSAAKKTLQLLGAYDILTAHGFVVVQHFKKDSLPDALGDLVLFKQKKYGDTVLSFYKKRNQEPEHRNQKNLFL